MSAVLHPPSSSDPSVDSHLTFLTGLQALTNKIHATRNIDEIMLDLSADICRLFGCDRLTLYVANSDGSKIESKVKTGLNSSSEIRLPVSEKSVAGFVALTGRTLNIKDVYDAGELQSIAPSLQFLGVVDAKTGYRSKQMLVAPIRAPQTNTLLGVIQLINNLTGVPFDTASVKRIDEICQTLAIAFSQRQARADSLFGMRSKYDLLIEQALLAAPEMELATRTARRKAVDIELVLQTEFQIALPLIGQALSQFYRTPYQPLKPDQIKPVELFKNIKREYAEENKWLPIEGDKNSMIVVALDPERIRSSGIVNQIFPRAKIDYRVTTIAEFAQMLDQLFGQQDDLGTVNDMLSDMLENDEENNSTAVDIDAAQENELVRLVNKIIIDAHRQGVSDIHIEPGIGKNKTGIRFRKDGSLVPYIEVPATYRNAMVARIKIMCELDISERRKPQDGKIKFKKFGPLDIELRVATIPSAGGVEDIVMRILAAGEPIELDQLGVLPYNLARLKKVISAPYGLFFVCGPTGSGKTTTLHSVLSHLNVPETKIWTAEDPVEITQKGLRQVQVNRKAGLDFATVMRSFLRADPDVIMVGEMRDKETVSMGIEASLTGHLVLATLHTNSAPESIVRLLDMGMDPFNFADALLGILAQRLAKRLCSKCKQSYQPEPEEMQPLLTEYCEELMHTKPFLDSVQRGQDAVYREWEANHANDEGRFTLYRAVGCEHCNNGYRGRVGLHELMIGTDRIKKLLQEHSRVATLLAAALEDGMLTLKMDGIQKVLAGITDIKAVRAVCIK